MGVAGLAVMVALVAPGTAASLLGRGPILVLFLPLLVATGAARTFGERYRRLTARVLGEEVAAPPPLPSNRGRAAALRVRLGDTAGWRAVGYLLVKVPFIVLECYALAFWVGAINMTYPFWWRLFRNHAPGVRLSPVPFVTPLGAFHVATFPGTLVVFAVGLVMVLAAPWVTRSVTLADRWLVRSLLGPGRLAERVRDLEASRAQVVDDSATRLRRIERDLHDGTQAQLAALAMKLGQAKEKLEHGAEVPFDPSGALELVETAHHHAKEALIELRDIARGIHPPTLDLGLDTALTTLVARSAIPATLRFDVESRPTPAIETIAYYSTAELLANVAKHSQARTAAVDVTADGRALHLRVSDDGMGGAQPGAGSGLTGLAERVRAVDGRLHVSSPEGGPTVVTVELPLHA
jgi:signal transduction histidine kinase